MTEKLTVEVNHNKARYLKEAAQEALKDERHWSVVDVADRAASAQSLATMILSLFNEAEDGCPEGCEKCQEHRIYTGEEGNNG